MNSGRRQRRSTTNHSARANATTPAFSPAASSVVALAGGDELQSVARLVSLEPGLYSFRLAAEAGWREPMAGLALPAVQVCPAPASDSFPGPVPKRTIEITDSFGHAGGWLGGRHKVLFVTSPAGGGRVLVTGYLARDADGAPLALDIRRVDPAPGVAQGNNGQPRPSELGTSGLATAPPPAPLLTLNMGGPAALARPSQEIGLDIVAHIRSRGDVRFDDAPWAGRLGPGLWIEAFAVFPRARPDVVAIEYKGLAASGAETPWIDSGSLCGSRGQATPLIGFAVRQKAIPGGEPVDCEYTGYFRSGATVGPARNGAPCRSAVDNDPLEGMQLRITPRPATHRSPIPNPRRYAAAKPA